MLKNPLICALDLDSPKDAILMARAIGDRVGAYKVGPRLLLRGGAPMMDALNQFAPVFVDFKFYDIPSTTYSSVQTAFQLGATLVTVHASAGVETLQGLANLEAELNEERPFKILAVTILTSFNDSNLPKNLKKQPVASHVFDLCD
ncbi:MAG: orotidine 5'-phosphate decarboxylase, partial [Bdellovibrionales bacterium]|nr:orotidine 5'-phosphate decarboxylase [Bdellovibrionales bacterium]